MKTTLIKISALLLITAQNTACNSNTKKQTEAFTATVNPVTATDSITLQDAAQDQIFKQYLQLKDDLVVSDQSKSQKSAAALSTAINANPSFATAKTMADSIANSTDLAAQRSTFTNLSNQLIAQFRKAKLAKGSFYVQFCPMANEGNGGYWLAAEQEVRNPYYGDEMLNCGEVKETIK